MRKQWAFWINMSRLINRNYDLMKANASDGLVPHLFRLEYTKMTAVICRLFGLQHIEIAEDIVSETFLKATEAWSFRGIPENATAWLYTVAKNKTKDYLKRNSFFEKNVLPKIKAVNETEFEIEVDFTDENIKDSQLAMIFAVCNPVNAEQSQVSIALQILCGFSVEEIANAFLTNKETIKKRLFRARENLRNQQFKIEELNNREITDRLNAVLITLYLLFNEGYFSKSNDNIIRKDLCFEAMRLTGILTDNKLTDIPKVNALLALQCFQSSRLEARINEMQEAVLFDEQDKNLWDASLIEKGNYHLIKACQGDELSKYHLEASIAYWHSSSAGEEKWRYILQLYDQLLIFEYSPVTAMNRLFAFAKVYGNKAAIDEAERLNLQSNHYYFALLGYLYETVNPAKAIEHYTIAVSIAGSETEKKQFEKAITKLKQSVS